MTAEKKMFILIMHNCIHYYQWDFLRCIDLKAIFLAHVEFLEYTSFELKLPFDHL